MNENTNFTKNKIEHEKSLVENIEKLNTYDESRIDLILTWKGYKPGTDFLVGNASLPVTKEELEKMEREASTVFDSLGLSYAKRKEPTKSSIGFFIEYLVTKEKDKLKEYRNIWEGLWGSNPDHKSFGKMMGFPETAINAYLQGPDAMLSYPYNFPEEIDQADYMAFLGTMGLSKDNWRQELKIVQKWAEEIKQTDPALYEREVKKYHEQRLNLDANNNH